MRRISIALTVMSLAACGDLQHESPFDPETPPDQQARTSFSGTVALEPVGGAIPPLNTVAVSVAGQSYSAATDDTGHYTITGVPPGTYTLQAVLDGYETTAVSGITATLDTGGTTVTVPTLSMKRLRADLVGQVQLNLPPSDPALGNPTVETTGGATVLLEAAPPPPPAGLVAGLFAGGSTGATGAAAGTAVTDSSGVFVIPAVPAPLSSYTLTTTKYGYVTQTTTVIFTGGAFVVSTVELEVDPGSIAGTVIAVGRVDLSGIPDSSGIVVRAKGTTVGGTPYWREGSTAVDGSYRISDLPAGTYGVSFELADHAIASTTAAVIPGSETTLDDAQLFHDVGALTGTVDLAGAASSAGAVVTATLGTRTESTVTDSAGGFTLSGLETGSWNVVVRKDPDWIPSAESTAVITRNATATFGATTLSPVSTASITGKALLEGVTDHAGTTVTLTGTDFRGVAVAAGTTTGTDSSGNWSFTGLKAGSYQVAFTHAAFDAPAPVGLSLVTGQVASVGALTLAASRGGVGGTVTASGAANDAGTVVEIAGGPDPATAVTDAGGAWSVTGLRVGSTYTATYRRTGYTTPAPAGFSVTAGTTTPLGTTDLLVTTTASITGVATVQRPGDAPASAGILVSLTGTDLNGASVTASTDTVSGGAFTLSGLPQGTYTLTFSKEWYESQTRSGLALASGGTATAPAVVLPVATGNVAGQVLLSKGDAAGFVQGSDCSGVVVTLTGLDAGVSVPTAVTDASGNFRFDSVPVSTTHSPYGVVAQLNNYSPSGGSVTADPSATVTVVPSPLTLSVNVGSVTGNVAIDDTGTRVAPPSGAVTVSVTGAAFNSTAFAASAGNVEGNFTLPNLPAGTYTLAASSPNRSCLGSTSITVEAGKALDVTKTPPAYTFVCTDSVAPGPVALGVPQGPGAQPGFTSLTGVDVPIVAHASDASSNLRGYQYVAGATPSWTGAPVTTGAVSPVTFPDGTLTADGTWTLWIRAVDWAGNAGPASSVQVVRDVAPPADVAINTARIHVNATSTTAILTDGSDANFLSYQWCMLPAGPLEACPAPCTPGDSGASIAITFDAPNRKACVWAQARDKANNLSANLAQVELISDLTPPTGPLIAPLFDPTTLAIHAEYVDFSIVGAARDAPAGGTTDWKNVAWIEVDTGNGFAPLCPDPSCHPGGVYDPCNASCACADEQRLCRGTTFTGLRLPLAANRANQIAVRAVDLAGNYGSGASQQVQTRADEQLLEAADFVDETPRVRGRLAVYSSARDGTYKVWMTDLGTDHVWSPATDTACALGYGNAFGGPPKADVLRDDEVVRVSNSAELVTTRPGPDGAWCTGDEPSTFVTGWAGYTFTEVVGSTFGAGGATDRIAFALSENYGGANTKYLGIIEGTWTVAWPYDATSDTAATGLALGGEVLLYEIGSTWTVLNSDAVTGSFGGTTTGWTIPGTVRSASLSRDGTLLAWIDVASTPVLYVMEAGSDGRFQETDTVHSQELDGTNTWADVAVEAGHVVAVENGWQSTYYVHHWYAGGDGLFETADDTYARILPSSRPRYRPVLADGIGAGQAYYTVGRSGLLGENPDILSADLTSTRWEVARKLAVDTPRPNGKGTLFYKDSNELLTARTSNGTEYQGSLSGYGFSADGDRLYQQIGADLMLHTPTSGKWFTTAGTSIFSKLTGSPTAGDGHVIARTNESSNAISVLVWNGITTTQTRLDTDAAFAAISTHLDAFGTGVSSLHAAWTGLDGGMYRPLFRSSVNGLFGDGDDVSGILVKPPATATKYAALAVTVSGNRVVMVTDTGFSGYHVIALDAGSDKTLNTADDVEYDLGACGVVTADALSAAGDYVAWSSPVPGMSGSQIVLSNVRGTASRVLTDWYSFKPAVEVEPSGRVFWVDQVFPANSIFIHAP